MGDGGGDLARLGAALVSGAGGGEGDVAKEPGAGGQSQQQGVAQSSYSHDEANRRAAAAVEEKSKQERAHGEAATIRALEERLRGASFDPEYGIHFDRDGAPII